MSKPKGRYKNTKITIIDGHGEPVYSCTVRQILAMADFKGESKTDLLLNANGERVFTVRIVAPELEAP